MNPGLVKRHNCRVLAKNGVRVGAVRDTLDSSNRFELDATAIAGIISSSEDAVIIKSLEGTILNWNDAAARLFGYRREEMVGQPITRLFPPELITEELLILDRIRRGKRIKHYETARRRKDGQRVEVSVSISPVRNASGRIVGAAKFARDITERKEAEVALRDSERRLRAIVDTAVDAIITIDERGVMESANKATERLFGYAASELIGHNVRMLMPRPYAPEHDGYLRRYQRTGNAKVIGIGREVLGLCKDGSTFPLNLSVSEIHLGKRRLFTGILHDLSERRRLEKEILEATTNEQRRIGQDLHDGLCQELIGISFIADSTANQLQTQSRPQAQAIRDLGNSIRHAAMEARNLAHGLNPIDMKAGGLAAALGNLAKRISTSFGVRCRYVWDKRAKVDADITATHLYRIAQEAAGNAIRHGKATTIEIRFACTARQLRLTVKDNGSGLPQRVIAAFRQGLLAAPSDPKVLSTGMGLQTMLFRARLIGYALEIRPNLRGGTTVVCSTRHGRLTSPKT